LFFRTDADELMAVPIKPAPRFEAGQPTRLFTLPSLNIGALMSTYDAAPDGERFIVLRPHSTNRPTPLTVAVNWDTEAAGASRGR
jgi:hypothetical protein